VRLRLWDQLRALQDAQTPFSALRLKEIDRTYASIAFTLATTDAELAASSLLIETARLDTTLLRVLN
jgi:hypothetical protein